MIGKRLEDIDRNDILALITDAVHESRTLEYKQELPGNGDEDKREFLADVSAFANTSGGDIIYGIVERRDENRQPTGEPEDAPGLNIDNLDAEIRRLENIIRDGIDPRMPVVHLRPIDGFAQGPVMLIRILQSWVLPHMVTYRGHSRFYCRNSSGKYPLDVSELRSAFLLSDAWADRVRRFRDERIARIVSGESCCLLS